MDTNNKKTTLEMVVCELDIDNPSPKTSRILKERITTLMNHNDIEVLGAIYAFVTDDRRSKFIEPKLPFKDIYNFLIHYYDRCFQENPKSKWADSRYSAGHDLVNWFMALWNDKKISRKFIANLKSWLARLYQSGDTDLRNCLVAATLEHLFETKKVRDYFSDWKRDPILSEAFAGAMEWTESGNKTPLGKQELFRKAKGAKKTS